MQKLITPVPGWLANSKTTDLLPNVPAFISRVRSGYAPLRGGLQIRLE
jgi:hypothetical protein